MGLTLLQITLIVATPIRRILHWRVNLKRSEQYVNFIHSHAVLEDDEDVDVDDS